MSLADFKQLYYKTLSVDEYQQCLPECFSDLCSGWTQETLRQVIMTLTRNGSAPIKLWYDSAEEMCGLSNKRQVITDIFRVMDTPVVLGRIDTLEVFAPIVISTQGSWTTIMQNIMSIFGFGAETEFSRDEFHFFIDCLFRGLFKLLIVKPQGYKYTSGRKRLLPLHSGKKLASKDIEKLVSQVFPNNIDILDRADFMELMQPTKEISELLTYFHEKCNQSVMTYR